MTDLLNTLEKYAERAAQSHWNAINGYCVYAVDGDVTLIGRADEKFIAAADPRTVRVLINTIRTLGKYLEEEGMPQEVERNGIVTHASLSAEEWISKAYGEADIAAEYIRTDDASRSALYSDIPDPMVRKRIWELLDEITQLECERNWLATHFANALLDPSTTEHLHDLSKGLMHPPTPEMLIEFAREQLAKANTTEGTAGRPTNEI